MAHNEKNAGRKRKLTPLEETDIRMMHEQGCPSYEIIAKYKISASTLVRILKRS